MTGDDDRRPIRTGGKDVADFELWLALSKSVKPLKQPAAVTQDEAAKPPLPRKKAAVATPASSAKASRSPQAVPQIPKRPPALTGLDRRTSQRMARGQVDVEARLDLHGEGAQTARTRLRNFLRDSRAQGRRMVLVITGKGASPYARHTLHGASIFHTPERQGVLRRLVPDWLNEAEFREHVAGFQAAHPKHGGGGAFYVRLRRA